jgi:multidrug efflux system membrane fusion protein
MVRATDNTGLVSITQTKPIYVSFTLAQENLHKIHEKQALAPLTVQAIGADNATFLSEGKLSVIDNAIDQPTGTIRIKATFENTDERLWPGEFVNARVLLDTRRNVVAIPTAAIQRGQPGLFVWVANADNVAEVRPIEPGPASGELTVIEKGVAEGDRVVTDGQYKLQVNARVTLISPAAAAAGAEAAK